MSRIHEALGVSGERRVLRIASAVNRPVHDLAIQRWAVNHLPTEEAVPIFFRLVTTRHEHQGHKPRSNAWARARNVTRVALEIARRPTAAVRHSAPHAWN